MFPRMYDHLMSTLVFMLSPSSFRRLHIDMVRSRLALAFLFLGLAFSTDTILAQSSVPEQSGSATAEVKSDPLVAHQATAQGQTPLSPEASLQKFRIPADLKIEDVLHEPDVAQPIFAEFDERGRLWVVEYLQYPDPANLKVVSHDDVWRAVYDKVPAAPPNQFVGSDRIMIYDHQDAQGYFHERKPFVEKLSIVTAVAQGRGGVWVLNPPYLLFYRDSNHDDVSDGDPEVCLAGFGLEDTHSVVNSLRWGPDGWLYGCQGSTVTGNVIRPGTDEKPVHSLGQAIWRYHPETRRYEIFAEGGGNAFGLEIDSLGRVFSGFNGGDSRGFYYVQGGYYQKSFDKHGPLSNPFTFGYFPAMKGSPSPRFTHTFAIYEGGALPAPYQGKMFSINPLLNQVILSQISGDTSTFQTKDLSYPVTTDDKWFRPVDIKVGPDGAVYVVDMYEGYISHRDHHAGLIDRSNGRIYRLSASNSGNIESVGDLAKKSTSELIQLLDHPNKWYRETALRLLGDRHDQAAIPELKLLLRQNQSPLALEALWAINLCGGFDDSLAAETLSLANPDVRLWTVRLLCDDKHVSPSIAKQLAKLATTETNVEVRSQLACSARRLRSTDALPILQNLLDHSEDAADAYVPLLLWWALEAKITEDPEKVLDLFQLPQIWRLPLVQQFITERLMRRFAATGKRSDLVICARLLKMAPQREDIDRLLAGFEVATAGRTLTGMPPELTEALTKFGGKSVILGLRQGHAEAVAQALQTIADVQADKSKQLTYLQVLGEVNEPTCVPILLQLIDTSSDGALRVAALSALQRYSDPHIADVVITNYNSMTDDVRLAALSLLVSRKEWTLRFLRQLDAAGIDSHSVPTEVVQHMQLYQDSSINELLRRYWGEVKPLSSAAAQAEINRITTVLNSGSGTPKVGKALFGKTCARCHTLFGEGGRVGPDLTSYKRDDLRMMLLSIVQPSAEIREGYTNYIAITDDGRSIAGLLIDQDPQVIALRTNDGKDISLPRDQIDELRTSPVSIMPEGLLNNSTDQELRDLFAYLRCTQPVIDN